MLSIVHFRPVDARTGTRTIVRLLFDKVAYKKLRAPPRQGTFTQADADHFRKTLSFAFENIPPLSADLLNDALERACQAPVRTSAVVRALAEFLGGDKANIEPIASCVESDFWCTDDSLVRLGRIPSMLNAERDEFWINDLRLFAGEFPEFLNMEGQLREALEAPGDCHPGVGLTLIESLVAQTDFFERKLVVPPDWSPADVAFAALRCYQHDQARYQSWRKHEATFGAALPPKEK